MFENDFAALLPPPGPAAPPAPHPLLKTQPVEGGCDVVVFHPRHDLTIARLTIPDIQVIVEQWKAVYKRRGTQEGIKYVQIFEVSTSALCSPRRSLPPYVYLENFNPFSIDQNKGAMMGCSNPHPHGQAWSLGEVPSIPATELQKLREYADTASTSAAPTGPGGKPCMLCEYAHFETTLEDQGDGRVVAKNDEWVAVVPWWAVWPYETLGTYFRIILSVGSELSFFATH